MCMHTKGTHTIMRLQVNPLAYWTFEDCFDYIAKYKIPIHPLHAQGYPSIGDAKDTVKVRET